MAFDFKSLPIVGRVVQALVSTQDGEPIAWKGDPSGAGLVSPQHSAQLGNTYSSFFEITGGVNQNVIQIWNPAASGKKLAILRVMGRTDLNGVFMWGFHDTELSTANGNGITNMLAGGAAGVGLAKEENLSLSAPSEGVMGRYQGLASSDVINAEIVFLSQPVVDEGHGFVFFHTGSGQPIRWFIEWMEL